MLVIQLTSIAMMSHDLMVANFVPECRVLIMGRNRWLLGWVVGVAEVEDECTRNQVILEVAGAAFSGYVGVFAVVCIAVAQ